MENTLRLYDAAIEHLALVGAQAGVLNSVAADKAVRDQAQMEAQRVAMTGSALSLNRGVYDALVAMDLTDASPATRHFVERTLLGYRWRVSTRTRGRAIRFRRCREGDHGVARIQPQHPGRREDDRRNAGGTGWAAPDTWGGISQTRTGRVTLTTDQPEMQPVMTFAANGPARADVSGLQHARLSANKQILMDLLSTRQEIATVLGFRSWADLATADQMMGSAANVRTFLAKLDEASREGAAASTKR